MSHLPGMGKGVTELLYEHGPHFVRQPESFGPEEREKGQSSARPEEVASTYSQRGTEVGRSSRIPQPKAICSL
jgi:hypothetical protein